ncbi:MAG: hypothetical protein FWF51_12195 [Chitinivibrionia bacterium]|nr:hypothetical protein [Chitinivibrionia bacterium]
MVAKKIFTALTVFCALAFVGCSDDDEKTNEKDSQQNGQLPSQLNGVWIDESDGVKLEFNNGNFVYYESRNWYEYHLVGKGTYTIINENTMTTTTTHIHGDYIHDYYGDYFDGIIESKWYTKNELKTALASSPYGQYVDLTEIDELFVPTAGVYSINGNTLTIKNTRIGNQELVKI